MNSKAYKMFSVEGKVIIITGGAGFLGMQYAKALFDAGAKVVLWDKSEPNFSGKNNFYNVIDITDENAVQKATQIVASNFGKIDVLINNAAMNPAVGSNEAKQMFTPYDKYSLDSWEKELKVNLTGMLICIQAVAPIMKKQRSGIIVNIASEFANFAADNRIYLEKESEEEKCKSIGYIVAKHGVIGLTRTFAGDLGKYGIRVNAFSPGGMPRPEIPEEFRKKYSDLKMLGRMAEVGEYNGAILFLCSEASSFMTGEQIVMNAGRNAWR